MNKYRKLTLRMTPGMTSIDEKLFILNIFLQYINRQDDV